MAYTPMMQQYLATKEQYKDCILFFRLGDFYEMFFDDAITASKDMEVVLTSKACGDDEKAPMCGVPYHAVETYVARLLEKGHKVAIAEQMEDPALAKGLVKREVIRVITPGTVISQNMLSEKENNFLASIYISGSSAAICWCDISTGEFSAMQAGSEGFQEQILAQLAKLQPKEIIVNLGEEEALWLWEQARTLDKVYISVPATDIFTERSAEDTLKRYFRTASLKSVGLAEEDVPELFFSVGALLGYLKDTQKQDVTHLNELQICDISSYMSLDKATIKSLEITETLFEHSTEGSLLGVLDRCRTAMGSRKMKQWLREPLNRLDQIQERLDAVELLCQDIMLRNELREHLKAIYDLERLTGRMSLGTANARDMIALKQSLAVLPDIKAALSDSGNKLLTELMRQIDPQTELCAEIEASIVDDPPFSIREGGIIKPGFSQELDDIKFSARDAQEWIASLEAKEKERTGIKTLRLGYNKVFGYYIEVSNSFKDKVPENYIRKQTLVNGERFVTPEMKEKENIVISAQGRTNDLEYRLFTALRLKAMGLAAQIQASSHAIAALDVLCSFAESSVKLGYVKPSVNSGDEIVIKKGRHPVIENTIRDGIFVSNDLYINRDDCSMLLITGPNMSGKSTYMRQLALIVLMAQAGCFVPADEAVIGICDRIYTRIGASDNIAMGQSTFFVEMSELAYILNTAGPKSLVILDEIGRGTSTWDGLSIAWAVVDYLTRPGKQVRTLFATHYHELTVLSESVHGVKNLNVDVSESRGSIVFLHKIVEGSASRSYGIHVAKLAGVPNEVLQTAEDRLQMLESGDQPALKLHQAADSYGQQLSMFAAAVQEPTKDQKQQIVKDSALAKKIASVDLMNITPSGAIKELEELKKLLD